MMRINLLRIAAGSLFLIGFSPVLLAEDANQSVDNIPVVYINTAGSAPIVDKENYIDATLFIDGAASGYESVGTAEAPVGTEIRGRGNFTWWGFNKKPYKLKLNKKTDLLNLDKNKHFALLAHADDKTGFLRNTIGFELSRRLGLAWTPGQRPVQLNLNNTYDGLYFLTQTIRVDNTRVDIVEQADSITDPAEITGGWLIEIDNYDTDPHVTVIEGGGSNYPIWFTYKTPEILSQAQSDYLYSEMSELNELIYSSDKAAASDSLCAMLDIDAFARFYLVQEITDNTESFHGSCYLWRNRGENEKWTFGPVWDFGSAFQRNKDGRRIWQNVPYHQVWVEELLKFPIVQEKIKEVWDEFATEENLNSLFDELTRFEKTIEPSMKSNNERWPEYAIENYKQSWAKTTEQLRQNLTQVGIWYDKVPQFPLTVYLRGDFNNWGLSDPFEYDSTSKVYKLYVTQLDTPFKIATEDWKTIDYGAPNDDPVDFYTQSPFRLTVAGKNIRLKEKIIESTLIFDPDAQTLSVTREGGVTLIEADENEPAVYFTLDGRPVDAKRLMPGLYIEKRGHVCRKIRVVSE